MHMKNRTILTILLSLITISCLAIPAKRVRKNLTLTDGSIVVATLTGDENGHWYVDDQGKALTEDSMGTAHYLSTYETELRMEARAKRLSVRNDGRKARWARRLAASALTRGSDDEKYEGYTGKKKGIVILVNFTDKKFTYTRDDFHALANEKGYCLNGARGSVSDYFRDQSYGKLEVEFDVVGPYNLSHPMAYYGKNKTTPGGSMLDGDDVLVGEFATEAVKLADKDVNFADYDWNHNGEVDQVYIMYAGYSEAEGGASTTIWPHEWSLDSAKVDNCGGDGKFLVDNVWVDTYACSSELKNSRGNKMCGIGTMCHEFSHCLGLEDLYDTSSRSIVFGMDSWSLMDRGAYNGDGHCPCGYTSYERWVAGWLEPVELTATDTYHLSPITQSPEAYIIYNEANRDEYYLLENRQLTLWDEENKGHGLLILHVDYDDAVWSHREINNDPSHQRLSIFHADNKAYSYDSDLAGDPYPGTTGNRSLTDASLPSAKLFNANRDGRKYMGKPITDITEEADGTITFSFTNPRIPTGINPQRISAPRKIYSVSGQYMGSELKKLPRGMYKIKF
jgi:M6 family metalloprotease-like protein